MMKIPTILIHGYWETSDFFRRIEHYLSRKGYPTYSLNYNYFVPISTSIEMLKNPILRIMFDHRADKVHLIGHSWGGVISRAMASSGDMGALIASITTVGSPHNGMYLFHRMARLNSNLLYRAIQIGTAIRQGRFTPTDMAERMKIHTTREGLDFFNEMNPNVPDVYYQSYGGNIEELGTEDLNPVMLALHKAFPCPKANDALFTVEDTKWGDYQGTLPADHLQLVTGNKHFEPLSFYLSLRKRLDSL